MNAPSIRARLRRAVSALLVAAAAPLSFAACDSGTLLSVTDPDIINPTDVMSSAGATAVRLGAIGRLNAATSGGTPNSEGLFLLSGLFADEWQNGDSFIARQEIDQRVITIQNNFLTDVNRGLNRARLSASQAAGLLRQYTPGATADIAEMYFVQAYVENLMGEHYCNGLVFSTVVDGAESFGTQVTTTAAFERALAHADSGLALITGSTAADARIRNALRVTRGRILVNLARWADAGAAVAGVPTTFAYQNLHAQTTSDNQIWAFNNVARRYSVSTREGGNGVDFATAADPRLPVCVGGDAACVANGTTLRTRDDGSALPLHVQLVWRTRDVPVTLAGGVEARLIEAEAAYRAGSAATFVQKLNQARSESGVTGLTATLADPGSNVTREDLLFRERAIALFSTGHRVGDLRRLIRQYGRPASAVFPTGAWHKGGNYGTDVNFPVPQAEENNPNVPAGKGCIDRNA